MGEAPVEVLEHVSFTLERREVVRLLGYTPGRKPPAPPVAARIEEMVAESRLLVEPRGCYAIKTLPEAPGSGPFRGALKVAFSVTTIGRGVEDRVAELSRRGETLRALILDAIGSASVEAVTDVVNALICKHVGQTGVFSNRRISPGYRGWPIEGQREIFGLLPSRLSGVTLKPTLFMEPRKSVSSAISIGPQVPHSKYVTICAYCDLRDCGFRRAPDPDAASVDSPH
jgi:hypothetical protein